MSKKAFQRETGLSFPASSPRERARIFRRLQALPQDQWFGALRIGYTEFFRHPLQLQLITKSLLPRLRKKKLNILSIPCSTGEEVFTLGMLLFSEGLRNYRVTGIDLDPEKLVRASVGLYPREQVLREIPPRFRKSLMKALRPRMAQWFQVAPEVLKRTRFTQKNILGLNRSDGSFDIILCRNLFHFFEPDTTLKALARIRRVLQPHGYLIVSPGDKIPPAKGWMRVAPCVYQALDPKPLLRYRVSTND